MSRFSPEFRHDPISGRTVIVAPGRGERPHDFRQRKIERVKRPCPFCRGREEETPAALAVYRDDHQTGDAGDRDWLVRVIPNKYSAMLSIGEDADAPLATEDHTLLPYTPRLGAGAHEVIVESARHVTCFSRLADREAEAAMRACRDRIRFHAQCPWLRHAQAFKNSGHDAGASVEHVHSQLMATPFLPLALQRELAASLEFFQQQQQCIFCDMLARERSEGVRLVLSTDRFAVLCPFAARFPYETWILPHAHLPRFDQLDDAALAELGPLMRAVVGAITGAAGQPAYNYFLHTAPFDTAGSDHYHWHIEMFPRTNEVGGYEWATGCFINSVPPEKAAAAIRAACADISNWKS